MIICYLLRVSSKLLKRGRLCSVSAILGMMFPSDLEEIRRMLWRGEEEMLSNNCLLCEGERKLFNNRTRTNRWKNTIDSVKTEIILPKSTLSYLIEPKVPLGRRNGIQAAVRFVEGKERTYRSKARLRLINPCEVCAMADAMWMAPDDPMKLLLNFERVETNMPT